MPAGTEPEVIAVSPNDKSVYVANASANSLSQYDIGATGALTPKNPPSAITGTGPTGVAVSPDGRSVYVANVFDNTVSQFNVRSDGTLTPKTPATVPAGTGPGLVAVTPDGKSVYVTNKPSSTGPGAVFQFRVGANGVLLAQNPATVTTGVYPAGAGGQPGRRERLRRQSLRQHG